MIIIKKAEDISEQKFENRIEAFSLCDDEKPVMYCIYKTEGEKFEIYDIKGDISDAVLIDALVRAVASYCEGRGADTAVCRNKDIFGLLSPLGFKADKFGNLTAKTVFLLRHMCCGGK